MTPVVPDRERVVEVIADSGSGNRPRWRYGSGFLVAGRQVLTSAHVVSGAVAVHVRTPEKASMPADLESALVGVPDPAALDLALVEVPQADFLPSVPIALVDRDASIGTFIENCASIGYPSFQEVGRHPDGHTVRETAQIRGRIAPLSGLVERLLSFEVTATPQRELPPAQTTLDRSEWSGMSGAPVLASEGGREYLVGVVAEHAPRRGPSSITVLPLDRLLRESSRPADASAWWARLGVADPSSLPLLPRRAGAPAPPRPESEPEMVVIGAGQFFMGADDSLDFEGPRHLVRLPEYALGKYPVTNAEFEAFVRATRYRVPPEMGWEIARFGQAPPADKRRHPVVGISWDDAVAYCRWLAARTSRLYRLPSEAEWEKAARGMDGRRYPWGDIFESDRCNSAEAHRGGPIAVDACSPRGDSAAGCADLVGNVAEWTSTTWGPERSVPRFQYPYSGDDGREDPTPSSVSRELRVCRGGSFREGRERTTCYARFRHPADSRASNRGFRVALQYE